MLDAVPSIYSLVALGILTFIYIAPFVSRGRFMSPATLAPLWGLVLAVAVAEWFSFTPALWLLAVVSFCALREYLSLVDIRLEDRWGILVSYLSIPFMFYLIQIQWYGFFIISIPVYTFLLLPYFVALGGRSKGLVFSVGALNFGLFFFVFCMGHLAYLLFYSERITLLLIGTVVAISRMHRAMAERPLAMRLSLQFVAACAVYTGVSGWTGIPMIHSFALGVLVPILVCLGRFTLLYVEEDLGIRADRLQPGRGRLIEGLKSTLFTAPIVFHYLRWMLKWGDL